MQGRQQSSETGMGGVKIQDGAVMTCAVEECSYNQKMQCHADEIKVGDGHAKCDTYTRSQVQASREEGVVANCDATQCAFNDNRWCGARGITVGSHAEHADCVTFRL